MTEKKERRRRQYGTGSLYQRSSDGRWIGSAEVGWTVNGTRRRVTVSGTSEAAVKRALDKKVRAIKQGGSAATDRTTVKTWAEEWLVITERDARPNTHTTDRGGVRRYIIPAIGTKRLDQLTPADVRAVAHAVRSAGATSTTAHRYHSTLMRMLRAAAAEGHEIPANVLAAKAPTDAATDRAAMPVSDAIKILQTAAGQPYASLWVAMLLEGLRIGERLGLTWDAVDLDQQVMTIDWQLQQLPYNRARDRRSGFRIPDGYEARHLVESYHLVRPKSSAGWRTIPLVPWMTSALRTWREVAPESPHGLVWPRPDGRPINDEQHGLDWYALQQAAGVAHPSGRPYYGHEARHTTATLLMELGVPEAVRIAILGHSSMRSTRGYEHADRALALAALSRLAERLELSDGRAEGD